MSKILDAIRKQYPAYKDTPDDELTLGIGSHYPVYLNHDDEFRTSYHDLAQKAIATGLQQATGATNTLLDTLSKGAEGSALGREEAQGERIRQATGMEPEELEGYRNALPTIGKGAAYAGKGLVAGLADIGERASLQPEQDVAAGFDPRQTNLEALRAGEELPTFKERGALPTSLQVGESMAQGLVQSAPQMAATVGLTAAGVPAPLAAGTAFGITPEGFSPKQAVIAAALPYVGKYGGEIAEAVASRLGVSTPTAMNVVKAVGGAGASAGFITADQAYEISKLPKSQQGKAWIDAAGAALSQLALGVTGTEGTTAKEMTARALARQLEGGEMGTPAAPVPEAITQTGKRMAKSGTAPIHGPEETAAFIAGADPSLMRKLPEAAEGRLGTAPTFEPSGASLVQEPVSRATPRADIALTPELQERLPQRPAPAMEPPSILAPPTGQVRATRALQEQVAQRARAEDFSKAIAEKVSQDYEPPTHPTKALTENQLNLVNDSLVRSITENRLAEDRPGVISGSKLEKWADDTLRGGGTHLGPDVVAAYLVKGAAVIERGVTNFAEWSREMVKQAGEGIRPHLEALYAKAKEFRASQEGPDLARMKSMTPAEANEHFLTAQKPQLQAVQAGLKLDASDVPRLEQLRKATQKELLAAVGKQDNDAIRTSMGKNVWYSGAIEGARRKGPNYDAYLKLKEKGDANAIQERSTETPNVGKTPGDSSAVGARVPGTEESANAQREGQAQVQTEAPVIAADVTQTTTPQGGIVKALTTWADDVLKGGATHAGPDVFAAYAIKGAEVIARGTKDFAQWSAAMVKEHGDEVRPFLRSIYTDAKDIVERNKVPAAVTTPQQQADASTPQARGIRGVVAEIGNVVAGLAGKSAPRTTRANRAVGEQLVKYASSAIAARPLAQRFVGHVLEGLDVNPHEFGAALVEDNLRSIRAARDEGAPEVTSLIGAKGSPFKTEAEYQSFLARPEVQEAIARHRDLWDETIDPQYKEAQRIDPDVELPTRGAQTGARVNLKVDFGDETPSRGVQGTSATNLTNTFRRKSPFAIRAKGTGDVYETDYNEIVANTFERQLEIANKNKLDRMMVDAGLAQVARPGTRVMIDGTVAKSFPLQRRLVGKDGNTVPQNENLYVRADLAPEYRRASNVDERFRIPYVTAALNKVNRAALAGLTDFTIHSSNLLTALFNRPTSGPLLWDTLLSHFNRADVPVILMRALGKSFSDNKDTIAHLSEIGAMRSPHESTGILGTGGRILKSMDKVTRLVLNDTFQRLVDSGLAEDTDTARREYINSVGQYNRRLQGPLTRFLRDTGFGPFVTAGKTFNTLGLRMATLDPGVKGVSLGAEAALRLNVLSKWVGAATLVGTLNYLLTSHKGGGVMGRPGTPLGNIDTGTNDHNGSPQSIPAFDIIGLGRALRVTGARGAIDTLRKGLTPTDAAEAAGRDIINSQLGPAAGPPVRMASTAIFGQAPAVNVARTAPVAAPGRSQFAANAKAALLDANPVVATIHDIAQGKSASEVLKRQAPRFTMVPGKPAEVLAKYPTIVQNAQINTYAEYIAKEARKVAKSDRQAWIAKRLVDDGVDPAIRGKVSVAVRRAGAYK